MKNKVIDFKKPDFFNCAEKNRNIRTIWAVEPAIASEYKIGKIPFFTRQGFDARTVLNQIRAILSFPFFYQKGLSYLN